LSGKTLERINAQTKAARDKYSTIFSKENISELDEEISVWFLSSELVISEVVNSVIRYKFSLLG
jgi:hypothetical protein